MRDDRARQRDHAYRQQVYHTGRLRPRVQAVLDAVAVEFARRVLHTRPLRAAAQEWDPSQVDDIGELWAGHVPELAAGAAAVYQAAAESTIRRFAGPSALTDPDHPLARQVTTLVDDYLTVSAARLARVGETLRRVAQAELAEGTRAGESIDQLTDRLRRAFAERGVALGEARAEMIARTETAAAWSRASLDVATALPEDVRPGCKTWLATLDTRTRDGHYAADGQTVPINAKFTIGGELLDCPGDPAGSAANTINCRCVMVLAPCDAPPLEDDGRQYLTPQQIADVDRYYEDRGVTRDPDGAGDRPGTLAAAAGHGPGHHQTGRQHMQPSLAAAAHDHAGEHHDFPLTTTATATAAAVGAVRRERGWTTPEPYALAFEDTVTGDGRVFTPGAIRWRAGELPLPLQYAAELLPGHDGARLCGEIQVVARSGQRIVAAGVIYGDTEPGAAVIDLLDRDAPVGVSVDLDDVTVEVVDVRGDLAAAGAPPRVRVPHLSVLTTPTGVVYDPPPSTVVATGGGWRALTATAGDRDPGGEVVDQYRSDDVLFRVVDARLRGATLVTLPAFASARIVLDPTDGPEGALPPITTGGADPAAASGGGPGQQVGEVMAEILDYVASADGPVRPGQVADALGITGQTARTYLARAYAAGRLARPARGLYTLPGNSAARNSTPPAVVRLTAAVVGNVDLPVHPDRDRAWDGPAAASRVLDWANQRAEETGQAPGVWIGQAFLYRVPDGDPNTLSAYRLGFADVIGGELRIVARGVFATAGGRGVDAADLPEGDREEVRGRICQLYDRLAGEFDEPDLVCPWQRDTTAAGGVSASAWAEFDALPPLPAAWFAEPTAEELPPDSGGVHVTDDGRIYGWVAQRGVPHEGFPGRNLTIDDLEPIDTTWFLRRRFRLDDGREIPLGPFVMHVGHHRDGGECETQACLWDDSRTIAGLITVGGNERGWWFSGAAAPWLSQWDLAAFLVCQPSYHVVAKPEGGWRLAAVLAVPRPGHPSRLLASVAARANLALTTAPGHGHGRVGLDEVTVARIAEVVAAAVVAAQERRERVRAEVAAMRTQIIDGEGA